MLEGLPPNGAAYVMRLACDEKTARTVADIVVETFDPAETAAAAFETAHNEPTWQTQNWTVEVFFGPPPDERRVRELVAAVAGEAVALALVFERIDERDWVQASLDGLAPVRAGRFILHGAHARGRAAVNEFALEIEAALAFGTGHHGTTRGCLLLLESILKRRRPQRVLDIGTGTGVLAMAAAKALHHKIEAGDIDPIAVAAATANARRNQVGPWVRPVAARGLSHPLLRERGPYDLVFANILARPLRALAPAIAHAATPSADLILSGLLTVDVPGVLSAYRGQGFFLAKCLYLEGWASLLLRCSGGR